MGSAASGQRVNTDTADKTVAGISQYMPGMEIYGVRVCIAPIASPEARPSAIVKESEPAQRSYFVYPFRKRSCTTGRVPERAL